MQADEILDAIEDGVDIPLAENGLRGGAQSQQGLAVVLGEVGEGGESKER